MPEVTGSSPVSSTIANAGRRRLAFRFAAALGLVAATGLAVPAAAQGPLPTVSVVVSLEVHDFDAWLGLHHEILGTAAALPKPFTVLLPARTGGSRSITLAEPKFSVAIGGGRGTQVVRVRVKGKIAGTEALHTLPLFLHALNDTPGRAVVKVEYGLSSLAADLAEVRMEDR